MITTGIDTQLLAATLAKGTILLVVAVGVAAALRRSPAGARHLVWLTTLATVLLFPVFKELLESKDATTREMAVRALAGKRGPWPWPWPRPRPSP